MFESDLIIQGGAFDKPTELKGILGKRMNIAYGRNGSGKSTIARAFREQLPDRQAINPARQFELSFDGSGSLDPEVCRHLFVFNEDFIDNRVKVKDGLRSIIRIGTSAELDAPIQDAKDKVVEYRKQLDLLKAETDVLNGTAATAGSIEEAERKFRDALRKPGGYADRLLRIDGRQNLVASVLTPVLSFDPNDTLPQSVSNTARQLNEAIDRYLSIKSGVAIAWQEPSLSPLPDLTEVNTLLTRTVRPAELTDEEKRILDELSEELASEDFIPKTERIIINSTRHFCPLCHQSVSDEHKQTLRQRLVRFRDKTIQEFKETVSGIKAGISYLSFQPPLFPTADYDGDIHAALTKLEELNAFISQIKAALEKKAENPFSQPGEFDPDVFVSLVASLQAAISRISDDVAAYNRTLQEKDTLKKEIDRLNIRLAFHENKTEIATYKERVDRLNQINDNIHILQAKIEGQNQIIDSLSAQIDQVEDARDQINNYLSLIFGNKKLRLVPAGKEMYKLQVKQGNAYTDIPPEAVSCGERNALALSYFFACVLEKKDKNYNYGDPTLLVIDDPVSSYDAENKAGVLSLLSMQIKKVLIGNEDSKVLVLTHDFTTLRELCDQRARLFPKNKREAEKYLRLLQNHRLIEKDCSTIRENMEYYNALQSIFYFANCQSPEDFNEYDSMGNSIRSFAESYASRQFKCKWMDLFLEDKHLDCLPEELREKIKSFAIRPVLNSESHTVGASFEPEDVQRAARVVLVYVYYATWKHLYAYLVGWNEESAAANEWKMDKIEEWAGEF